MSAFQSYSQQQNVGIQTFMFLNIMKIQKQCIECTTSVTNCRQVLKISIRLSFVPRVAATQPVFLPTPFPLQLQPFCVLPSEYFSSDQPLASELSFSSSPPVCKSSHSTFIPIQIFGLIAQLEKLLVYKTKNHFKHNTDILVSSAKKPL